MLVVIKKDERLKVFQDVTSFWMKKDKKEVSLQRDGSSAVKVYDLEGTDVKMWYGNVPEGEPSYSYTSSVEKSDDSEG